MKKGGDTFTNRDVTNQGFTLIELMIVVGLVGILASIAIPSYRGFVLKARQSEAKLMVSSGYTLEMSFFGEQGTFTAGINAIGYASSSVIRYYTSGFTSNAINTDDVGATCGPVGGSCYCTQWQGSACVTTANGDTWDESRPAGQSGIDATAVGPGQSLDFYLDGTPVKQVVRPDINLTSCNPALGKPMIGGGFFFIGAAGAVAAAPGIRDCWYMDEKKSLLHYVD